VSEIEKVGLTADEAAQALRVSERAMGDLLRTGKVKAVKIGNRGGWRIHPQAINDYLLKGDPGEPGDE
jgi:excisionase family DNA binding protein